MAKSEAGLAKIEDNARLIKFLLFIGLLVSEAQSGYVIVINSGSMILRVSTRNTKNAHAGCTSPKQPKHCCHCPNAVPPISRSGLGVNWIVKVIKLCRNWNGLVIFALDIGKKVL